MAENNDTHIWGAKLAQSLIDQESGLRKPGSLEEISWKHERIATEESSKFQLMIGWCWLLKRTPNHRCTGVEGVQVRNQGRHKATAREAANRIMTHLL